MDIKRYVEVALDLEIYYREQRMVLHDARDQNAFLTQDDVAQFCEQLLEMAGLGWQPIESAEKIIEKQLQLTNGITIRTGYWNGENWIMDGASDKTAYPATHFRPLPQPPKVKP